MPLPWKKSRVSRFSRIVADLHSPNRGNPLVVETGFPTSLVDLFVKNHERLKKPSKKKKKKQQQQEGFVDDLVISDPIPLSSSRDLGVLSEPLYVDNRTQIVENLEGQQENFDRCELVSELPPVENCVVVNVNSNGVNENGRRVLLVALKMLVVVILGLSTKKLAVGITMSAFVLIFLEYIGKHILCFLKPCSNALLDFQPWIFSFLPILKRVKNCESSTKGLNIQEDEEDVASVVYSCDLVETLESNPCIKEIQVVEPIIGMVARVEENKGTEIDTNLVNCAGRWGCLEVDEKAGVQEVHEGGIEVVVCEKESSRSTKIKTTFIKKLVPKKLGGRKKYRKTKEKELELSSEVSSCLGENQLGENDALEEHESHARQDLAVKNKLLIPKLLEAEEGETKRKCQQFDDGISVSNTELHAQVEMIIVEERVEIERKGNSGYFILCIVVLAGLVGGRILALVLTVVSCLMLKLVRRWRG